MQRLRAYTAACLGSAEGVSIECDELRGHAVHRQGIHVSVYDISISVTYLCRVSRGHAVE